MLSILITNTLCGLIGFIVFKKAMDFVFPTDPVSFYASCAIAFFFGFAGLLGLIIGFFLSVVLISLKLLKVIRDKMFYVYGGVYKDFTFSELETSEVYGPFETYEDAIVAWKSNVWQNVDNALHRLTIITK